VQVDSNQQEHNQRRGEAKCNQQRDDRGRRQKIMKVIAQDTNKADNQ